MVENRQINRQTDRRPRHRGALQNLERKAGGDKVNTRKYLNSDFLPPHSPIYEIR